MIPAIGPSGKASNDAPASGGKFLPVERQIFAVDARALFGGNLESEDGAVDFSAGSFDRLARFLREGAGKFFFALGDVLRHLPENALAFKSGQSARGAKSFDGGCNSCFGVLSPALKD